MSSRVAANDFLLCFFLFPPRWRFLRTGCPGVPCAAAVLEPGALDVLRGAEDAMLGEKFVALPAG